MRGTGNHASKENSTLRTGMRHHEAGQLTHAEECYWQVLEKEPDNAEALHLLGVAANQKGDYSASARLIKAAIQRSPGVSRYHGNLGNTYQLQGALTEAIESYKRALRLEASNHGFRHSLACALARQGNLAEAEETFRRLLEAKPDFADAHYNFGGLASRLGKRDLAEACYRRAIALRPDCFEFHFNLAGTLFALGRCAEAAESYRQALRIKTNDRDALCSLACALQKSGELRAAVEAYGRVLTLNLDRPSTPLGSRDVKQASEAAAQLDETDVLINLGILLYETGDTKGAAESFRRVLEQNANHVSALLNLGTILLDAGELTQAEWLLRRSLEIEPNQPNALCNLGRLYLVLGDHTLAIEYLKKALVIEPTHAGALCNLAVVLGVLGETASSENCYRTALERHPDHAEARYYLGLSQLAQGDFAEGWLNCEARWETAKRRREKRQFEQPQWKGEDIRGARILVFSDQGLGDALQFARYIPLLAERGATVYFEVQPGVQRLLQSLKGAERVLVRGDALPEFEWQCPLLSLPLGFHTELHNIPATVPYLIAPEVAKQAWSERMPPGQVRVGVAWSGNPKHARERHRTVPVEFLAELSQITGTVFYSLQKGPGTAQLERLGSKSKIINLDKDQKDFADTAAIVANLDLVITSDTSVPHLVGGMGKPVWILLNSDPDWRWLRGRDDSPWYPTARLFRQSAPGRWDDVVSRVADELRDLVGVSGAMTLAHGMTSTDASLQGRL